jgi:hypothetical protein
LGFSRFARHYYGNRSLFLALLRCFSSGGAPSLAYGFSQEYHPLSGGGLPHSEIVGSLRGSRSPTLFAAAHVLLRHATPRHPPPAHSSFFFIPLSARRTPVAPSSGEHPAATPLPRLCASRTGARRLSPDPVSNRKGSFGTSTQVSGIRSHGSDQPRAVARWHRLMRPPTGRRVAPLTRGLVVSSLQLLRCTPKLTRVG